MAKKKKENQFFLTNIEQTILDQETKKLNDNINSIKKLYTNKTPTHIIKKDRQWMNGIILDVGSNFFIIEERKLGRRIVMFHELHSVEELEKKND